DHIVGLLQERLRDREAERFSSNEIAASHCLSPVRNHLFARRTSAGYWMPRFREARQERNPSHDHALFIRARLWVAGSEPFCHQGRGTAENGWTCIPDRHYRLSQGSERQVALHRGRG